jgi:hypothetical protein
MGAPGARPSRSQQFGNAGQKGSFHLRLHAAARSAARRLGGTSLRAGPPEWQASAVLS